MSVEVDRSPHGSVLRSDHSATQKRSVAPPPSRAVPLQQLPSSRSTQPHTREPAKGSSAIMVALVSESPVTDTPDPSLLPNGLGSRTAHVEDLTCTSHKLLHCPTVHAGDGRSETGRTQQEVGKRKAKRVQVRGLNGGDNSNHERRVRAHTL
jgi:hypothetical protein